MTVDIDPFKVGNEDGEDWLIAFGSDERGKQWIITTNHVKASDLSRVSDGPQYDAQLLVKLMNDHYWRPGETLKDYVMRRLHGIVKDVAAMISPDDKIIPEGAFKDNLDRLIHFWRTVL